MELNELDGLLVQGQIPPAVSFARQWLGQASAGDVELGLRQCSDSIRPKASALLRDLLNRYPNTVLGCPMLLYAEPESEFQRALSFEMPEPPASMLEPLEGVRFLGWASVDDPIGQLPTDELAFDRVRAPLMRLVCRVAIFESVLDEEEAAALELPAMWWARVLQHVDVQLHVSARVLLPYTDAIEAGRCAQTAAQGRSTPTRGLFLSDATWTWAWNEGVLFKESCRGTFPHAHLP